MCDCHNIDTYMVYVLHVLIQIIAYFGLGHAHMLTLYVHRLPCIYGDNYCFSDNLCWLIK